MIKLRIQSVDERTRPLFLIGITRRNIDRLTNGEPIRVDLSDLGGSDVVGILFGEDAEDLRGQIERGLPGDDGLPAVTAALDQLAAMERESPQ